MKVRDIETTQQRLRSPAEISDPVHALILNITNRKIMENSD